MLILICVLILVKLAWGCIQSFYFKPKPIDMKTNIYSTVPVILSDERDSVVCPVMVIPAIPSNISAYDGDAFKIPQITRTLWNSYLFFDWSFVSLEVWRFGGNQKNF